MAKMSISRYRLECFASSLDSVKQRIAAAMPLCTSDNLLANIRGAISQIFWLVDIAGGDAEWACRNDTSHQQASWHIVKRRRQQNDIAREGSRHEAIDYHLAA